MNWNDVDASGLLQLAIEAFPSGILLIDSRGTIALVNRVAEHQFGYARADLIGCEVDRLLPDAPAPLRTAQAAAAALTPKGDATEIAAATLGLRKDGRRVPLDLRLKPMRTPDMSCVLVTTVERESSRANAEEPAPVAGEPAFERLAAELASQFTDLPDADLAAAIGRGLRQVSAHLEIDGAAFC